jgi:hypothetical protein
MLGGKPVQVPTGNRLSVGVYWGLVTRVPEVSLTAYLPTSSNQDEQADSQDLTVGQFVYVIRKRIKLAPEKAIFIFVDDILPPTAALMSSIYEEHKDEDGKPFISFTATRDSPSSYTRQSPVSRVGVIRDWASAEKVKATKVHPGAQRGMFFIVGAARLGRGSPVEDIEFAGLE